MRRVHRRGRTDTGAAWISYSDMMAALLLLFVLVLCYSVYQYFLMLETKTKELDEQALLLSAQQATLSTQQLTLDQQQSTLEKQKDEFEKQQMILLNKENELNNALTQLEEQRGLLDHQALTLEEQQKIIIAAQNALSQKELELNTANAELEMKQNELANATILLGQQQEAMNLQQQKLDDLVGVRTQIVRELTTALSQSNLRATVDAKTGDIVLESAVFFDYAKNEIKEDGKAFLDRFVPVYLSVLLQPEYEDYLGEIIIEGHTDTQGSYMVNLELSQDRALSVAAYCLEMPALNDQQKTMMRSILTAKGKSWSDPIYNANGTVNMDASRRVEFKFALKDSEMIDEIRQILSTGD